MTQQSKLFSFSGVVLLSIFELSAQDKPNIVFILADDLGNHDLSCTGSKYYETPNIDRIASEGMVFSNGYAACSVSSPSRASIFTGKFPARHGITDWIGALSGENWRSTGRYSRLLPPEYVRELPSSYQILPETLKEAGYITFFAGKWHLGGEGSYPEDHGFDINIGGWEAGSPKGGYFSPFENPFLKNRMDGEELSMRLAQETVKFLKEKNPKNTGEPIFAFLSFYAVHSPIETTQEKWKKYRDKAEKMGIIHSGFQMGHFLPIRQVQDNPVYAGLVEAMDDAVGEIIRALVDLDLKDNTIIIFTSDNGGVSAGDAFATSNLPLRGGKGSQFEGGIREPFFIKVPGMTLGGDICEVPVIGTDFYPTILELVGLEQHPEEHCDGLSLVPLMRGQSIITRPLIWHYPHYGNQGGEPSSIIREGDWKLIHYYEDGHDELYDLKNDEAERRNLYEFYPKIANDLHYKLFSYLKEVGARYPIKDSEYNKNLEENYLREINEVKLPQLEKLRLHYLSKDFNPGNNWWGSKIIETP